MGHHSCPERHLWLVVTAADIRGNETTKTVSFTVANEPATSTPA